jgi:hypothetical protein
VFSSVCGGTYDVTTCQAGTNFDTAIAVWDGAGGCGNLVPIGCNDDDPNGCTQGQVFGLESRVTFTAAPGGLYYISVGGYFGASGNFDLLAVTSSTVPVLTFINSGPGSIGYQIVGGPPNATTFNAVTLNAGAYPNAWFFGIDIGFAELIGEYNSGFPFAAVLNGCGGATVGPFCCLPSGLALYGVTVILPLGGAPTVASAPAAGIVP